MEKTKMADKKKSLHVKNTDRVMIIAGKDKGKDGNIKKVNPAEGTVVVEGLNMVTIAAINPPILPVRVSTPAVEGLFTML